jgi:hypothetical protein
MKKIILSIFGFALVLLTGCFVSSIYPFYTAKDLTFDPALLGIWGDAEETNDNKEVWVFEKSEAQTYKMSIRGGSETNAYDTHLFTLGGEKFLDNLPRFRMAYQTPEHLLLRVKSISPTLQLQLLDYEWLTKLVEQNPKAIRHIIVPKEAGDTNEGGHLTLTADTSELQKFLLKHLNNTNAWIEPMVMKKH